MSQLRLTGVGVPAVFDRADEWIPALPGVVITAKAGIYPS
jgi:hypothetical protein